MSVLEQGKWKKGQDQYWAQDGNIYYVNKKTGIYEDNEGVTRKAGRQTKKVSTQLDVTAKGGRITTKQTDQSDSSK